MISRYFFSRSINKIINQIIRNFKISHTFLYPDELFIEPTNLCNAKCPLCPTGTGQLKRKTGYMDFVTFKKIIDESTPFIKTIYLWNMGEPFLNKDIFKMIAYAKKQKIYTVSSTNGYVFYNSKNIPRLIKSGLDLLYVGMDGTDQKTFSFYRKNVDFLKVINGLKLLRDYKSTHKIDNPTILYQFIPMKHNEKQIAKAKQMAKNLNAKFVMKYLSLEMVNSSNKINFLPKSEKLRIYKTNHYSIYKKNKNQPCVLWNALLINWDGTVNPCIFDYYSKIELGNIKQQSISQIWKSPLLRKIKKQIIQDRTKINICQHCPIQNDYAEEFNHK